MIGVLRSWDISKKSKKLAKPHIKKLILRKLIGMEGRVQLSATPFAAERSRLEEVTQSFLREQHEPETRVPGRALDARTRNGNQFSLERKNSIFPSVEKCYFAFCPGLLVLRLFFL